MFYRLLDQFRDYYSHNKLKTDILAVLIATTLLLLIALQSLSLYLQNSIDEDIQDASNRLNRVTNMVNQLQSSPESKTMRSGLLTTVSNELKLIGVPSESISLSTLQTSSSFQKIQVKLENLPLNQVIDVFENLGQYKGISYDTSRINSSFDDETVLDVSFTVSAPAAN